jgi:2-keto-3-deoxy-L-rhamnonate aldolase RhmA
MSTIPISRLRSKRPGIGTWLSIGSPVIAELAAECAFDWLLLDLEHGSLSEAALLANLQAIKGSATVPIVRVGAPHPDLILRALDWGAAGIMVPRVESAEEAEACVQSMHYPPRGKRGMSQSARVYGYGVRPVDDYHDLIKPVLMVQIETLEGVRQADRIAAVDGVDILFVGPRDLAFDIEVRRDASVPDYERCLKQVIAAAERQQKLTGILVRTMIEAAQLRRIGFTHFAISGDLSILRSKYLQMMEQAEQHADFARQTAVGTEPPQVVIDVKGVTPKAMIP